MGRCKLHHETSEEHCHSMSSSKHGPNCPPCILELFTKNKPDYNSLIHDLDRERPLRERLDWLRLLLLEPLDAVVDELPLADEPELPLVPLPLDPLRLLEPVVEALAEEPLDLLAELEVLPDDDLLAELDDDTEGTGGEGAGGEGAALRSGNTFTM